MATNLSHSESSRLYSWWWDSHNTPKNSKWLQQNITDMDGKVKCMIKLIEEDADSFARRAEMYYKKRPELMKLVEEFYRAYRALAERYNHATGELRHAHKTIAAAFPDQVPFDLVEDPGTLETNEGVPSVCAITSNEPHKGLKQLQEIFGHETSPQGSTSAEMRSRIGHKDKEESCQDDVAQLLRDIKDLKDKILSETERAGRAEGEAHGLKKALIDMEAAKEYIWLQYQLCLKKVQETEGALHHAQTDSNRLTEKASRAEIEAQTLKEALIQLESEKNGEVVHNKENLEKISHLEAMASQLQDEAGVLKKQAERAEIEVSELKQAVLDLNKQKEASALQYGRCLEKISELEKDILSAKGEVEHLNHQILIGSSKLKTTEERSAILEMSNQALRVEAEDLAKKIAVKDQELSSKQEELESLQSGLDDESARRAQVEATLDTLQNLHSQSQDDQRALAMELKNMLQMLQGVEGSKRGLEEDIELARDGNYNLKEIRERLEKEVLRYTGISVSLQHEISCLKEEIELLNKNHRTLVDENFRLKQMHEASTNEREVLLKKLESIDNVLKKKEVAERCLSELSNELEISRENVKALQESYHLFTGEKAALAAEKASLLSQLQAVIENMNNLSGQNAVLENSLSSAKVELEGLREKSKGLEEICSLLKNERSHLLSERDSLVLKLEHVERRLGSLEKKFTHLGEKYADLEKENKAMHSQVEKLEASLGEEKQERIGTQLMSETRMAGLETEIHLLQEENRSKKKESDEEIEKSLKAQFEISIFQKFIQDMENKNYSLIIECQKHVEASKMAEKVISELESESLEQQVEAELLLDEIGRLRLSIYQIFTALDCAPKEEKVENEQTVVQQILESVEDMKCAISKNEDEKQQLVVENSILEALLEQLRSKGIEIESQKQSLEEEAAIMAEKLAILENEKQELLEMNGQLKTESSNGYQAAAVLQAALVSLCVKQGDLQTAYNALQNAYSQAQQENACLLKKFSDLFEEKHQADDHNDDILVEFLAAANQSAFLKSFVSEKTMELRSLLEDLNRQHEANSCLGIEMNDLGGKLDLQKAENLVLKEGVCRLEREIQEVRECNAQMKQDIASSAERLIQTKTKLFDTEMQLEATEKLNSTLFTTVAELKIDMQRSQQVREDLEQNMAHLSETNSTQTKQIQSLHNANTNLESELSLLHQEIEENVVREQTLSIELQGMNNEFELWEAEAATFCFDLQVSSVQEVLLKNKVQELTGVCQALEHQNAAKMSEFEEMKGKVCVMESEIDRLKSRLSAYDPVVASLRDDVMLIEQNALIHSKLKATHSQEMEFLEFSVDPSEATSQTEDQSLLSLQNLQMRVKAVGKLMDDTTKPLLRRRLKSKSKQEPVISEVDRSIKKAYMSELNDSPKLQKTKAKASEVRNVMLMKDIPLDQASDNSMRKAGNAVGSDDVMLELWETVEDGIRDHQTIRESLRKPRRSKGRDRACDQSDYMKGKSELPSTDSDMERELAIDKLELSSRFTEPYQDLNDKDILERLAFDAEKLEMLQTTLYDMRIKLETYKKSKKAKSIDFGAVKEQLQEADDTLVHLIDLNVQLVKNIEECPPEEMASPRLKETMKMWRIKVMEQAEKGSERINMLELAVQKIQFVLSKIEDEGKNKFLKSRTVILRDFIHSGRKNSGRRKKGPNCGCFKQSTSGNRSRS